MRQRALARSPRWLRNLAFRLLSRWPGAVGVQFNPLDPRMQANPYPVYRRLRSEQPIHWSKLVQAWVLTRYRDVVAVVSDPRFSADRRRARNPFLQEAVRGQELFRPLGPGLTMLGMDPPVHTRLRKLVSKAFTPRMVQNLHPHIQEIVDQLLDKVQAAGRFDIVGDLAYPLPVIVIAEILGVPAEDREAFKRWSDDAVATLGAAFAPPQALERNRRSIGEMADYFRRIIAQRRRSPTEDLLSALIVSEEQGQALSEEEMVGTCMLLLVAGNETTTKLLGNGMLALLHHPDQLQRLRQDPTLIPSAVEELLRYDGPAQLTVRVATENTQIEGVEIKEGDVVFAVLAAANRDPEVFDAPDELDIAREPNPHLAFGDGVHFCLGAPLARAETQIAIATILRRLPDLRLTGEPRWGGSFILRGISSLTVAF